MSCVFWVVLIGQSDGGHALKEGDGLIKGIGRQQLDGRETVFSCIACSTCQLK